MKRGKDGFKSKRRGLSELGGGGRGERKEENRMKRGKEGFREEDERFE